MSRYLIPLLLVAIATALFFGFTQPLFDSIQELKITEKSLNDAFANANQLKVTRDELVKKLNTIAPSDLDRLNKAIPDRVDNVRLVIDLDNLARQSGMSLTNIKIQSDRASVAAQSVVGPSGKKYALIGLSFSVAGSYSNLRAFLTNLERSLRIVDVRALSFTAGDKDSNEYSIELDTYFFKP